MTAFDASAWIGSRAVRPTTAQLDQIANYDAGLYQVGMDNLLRHLHYFTQELQVAAAVNNATVTGPAKIARVPFKCVAVDCVCESAAGSACTVTVEKALAATPTSYASMLEALVDVKTAAGIAQAGSVTSTKEDFAAGDRFRVSVVGTGAGAVVGAMALMHCFRL